MGEETNIIEVVFPHLMRIRVGNPYCATEEIIRNIDVVTIGNAVLFKCYNEKKMLIGTTVSDAYQITYDV